MSDATTFASLGVAKPIVAALAERGIEQAFPIQQAVIGAALAGRDICGKAPTGSGKTLAFGVPAVQLAAEGGPWSPTVLMLSPTRELATQIKDELEPLAKARSRRIQTVFGGTNIERDIKRLEQGADILVACPGRLEDLMSRRCVELRDVSIVVVDEADRLADMGFLPSIKRILDQTPDDRHTLLFSATLDGDVDSLIERYQRNPETFEIDEGVDEPGEIETSWHLVEPTDRIGTAAEVLRRYYSSIVFCRTRRGCDRVAKLLKKRGLEAVAIHGDRSQAQRERALRAFTSGDAQVLVATDVAARGIHVDDVELVLHYDPANSDKDHVHRSGRTGRAGRNGRVISLVVEDKEKIARQLQKSLGLKPGFTPLDLDSLPDPATAPLRAEESETTSRSDTSERAPKSKSNGRRGDRSGDRNRRGERNRDGGRNRGGQRSGRSRDRDDEQNERRDRQGRGRNGSGGRKQGGSRGPSGGGRGQGGRKQGDGRSTPRRRRGGNDWYPPGYDEETDRPSGGRNTSQRKPRSQKGRHADRQTNRNKGKRRPQ